MPALDGRPCGETECGIALRRIPIYSGSLAWVVSLRSRNSWATAFIVRPAVPGRMARRERSDTVRSLRKNTGVQQREAVES